MDTVKNWNEIFDYDSETGSLRWKVGWKVDTVKNWNEIFDYDSEAGSLRWKVQAGSGGSHY